MNKQTDNEAMKAFKDNVSLMLQKSQDDFEKQLIYISSGGLGASIFFIEKIVTVKTSHSIGLLVFGWVMLGMTLLINLFSHYLASLYSHRTLSEMGSSCYDPDKVNLRNIRINALNICSLAFLGGGLIFLLIYITINLKS